MLLSTLEKKVRRFVASVCDVQVVFYHQQGKDEGIVMLANKALYAVCSICPIREIVIGRNYQGDGMGILSAPMTASGLLGLVQWTDRVTAVQRFTELKTSHPHCGGGEVLALPS